MPRPPAAGAATPRIVPLPNSWLSRSQRVASLYETMLAMLPPAPGATPTTRPISDERSMSTGRRTRSEMVSKITDMLGRTGSPA